MKLFTLALLLTLNAQAQEVKEIKIPVGVKTQILFGSTISEMAIKLETLIQKEADEKCKGQPNRIDQIRIDIMAHHTLVIESELNMVYPVGTATGIAVCFPNE